MEKGLCLALCAVCCLLALGSAHAEDADLFMREESLRMAAAVAECGRNDAYLAFFGASEGIRAEAKAMADGISGAAQRVLFLEVDAEAALASVSAELAGLPDIAREDMLRRMPASMVRQLAAQHGAERLAASSLLSLSRTCEADAELQPYAVCLLEYGTETALACVFVAGPAGTVACTAIPISWDKAALGSLQMLSSLGVFTLREAVPAAE